MRAMRLPIIIILAFGLLLPVALPAETDPAPGARNVTREIPLGNSDIAAVEALLNENRSPFGTFTILKVTRVVKITDTPEKIEAARAMIGAMSAEAGRNIRIDVVSNKSSFQSDRGLAVSGSVNSGGFQGGFGANPPAIGGSGVAGTFTNNYNNVPATWGAVASPTFFFGGGAILPPPVILPARLAPVGTQLVVPAGFRVVSWNGTVLLNPPAAVAPVGSPFHTVGGAPVGSSGISFGNGNFRVGVNGVNQNTTTTSNASQFIVVGNGRAGAINVGRDIPLVTSFSTILTGMGITRFPDIHWEQVGTSMLVKATAVGNDITVEVTPRISQVVAGSGLGGPSIDLTELTSIVTVPNGGTTTIGGFDSASESFNSFFFGRMNSSDFTTGSITLKATIQ